VSDVTRRSALEAVLTAYGCDVVAVGRISEVERWPRGHVVVVERRFYSQLWLDVGAAHIVLVDDGQSAPVRHPRVTMVPDFVTNWRIGAVVVNVQRRRAHKSKSPGAAVALAKDRARH